MPTVPTWPGVYIEELPSGVRTITGVATSITAFVGVTLRGSVDEPIRCDSYGDFERACGGLWSNSELTYAVSQFFGNGGGTAIISRVTAGATPATATIAGTTAGSFDLSAADPGAWSDNLRVTVDHGGPAGSVSAIADPRTFHLTIDEIDPDLFATTGDHDRSVVTRESFPNVSTDPDSPRNVESVLESQSQLARVTAVPDERPIETTNAAFAGGGDSGVPVAGDYTPAIDRLTRADTVNLVSIPPPSRLADTTLAVWTEAETWCREHRAMLLVDPPASWTTAADAAALTGLSALRSTNTVFYWPRIVAADPRQANLARPFAPSGAVAGVIATTDAERGVWKAPAGLAARFRGVVGFEHQLTEADIGVVNERGVNALRLMPPAGPIVWGARTGRGADTMASEWKYLPVRRTALFIEESLFRGTQWAVFEPNDDPLWSQMRLAVGSFMNGLFRAGAFAGESESDAYRVVCDSSTTTQADIDRGILNVLVAFAPLKPAEFVVLRFQQLAGQAAA